MDGQTLYFAVQVALGFLGVYLIPAYGIKWISRALWRIRL